MMLAMGLSYSSQQQLACNSQIQHQIWSHRNQRALVEIQLPRIPINLHETDYNNTFILTSDLTLVPIRKFDYLFSCNVA